MFRLCQSVEVNEAIAALLVQADAGETADLGCYLQDLVSKTAIDREIDRFAGRVWTVRAGRGDLTIVLWAAKT